MNLTNTEYLKVDVLKRAYRAWLVRFKYMETSDLKVTPFLNKDIQAVNFERPRPTLGWTNKKVGWLEIARKSRQLSLETIAQRLKVGKNAYARLEKGEATGNITLAKLAKAAQALDCELVYAVRPKSRKAFSEEIWKNLTPTAIKDLRIRKIKDGQKPGALLAKTTELFEDTSTRRKLGWSTHVYRL